METKKVMIETLREAGYSKRVIADHAGVTPTALARWARGGECCDPEAFARLRKLYVEVCDKLGVKHD